jgi:hypothetical protein
LRLGFLKSGEGPSGADLLVKEAMDAFAGLIPEAASKQTITARIKILRNEWKKVYFTTVSFLA